MFYKTQKYFYDLENYSDSFHVIKFKCDFLISFIEIHLKVKTPLICMK